MGITLDAVNENTEEEEVNVESEESTEMEETVEATEEQETDAPTVDNTEDFSTATYDGIDFQIAYDEELAKDLEAKGFNIKELAKELYTSEDFSLGEASLAKLVEAYGKPVIDLYLKSLKIYNDNIAATYKSEAASREAKAQKMWEEAIFIVGKEENWQAMESWANSTEEVSSEDIAEFNKIMSEGTPYMQKLAIRDMYNKFSEASGSSLSLEQGQSSTSSDENGPLSREEYNKLIRSGKYAENPDLYDQRRRAGMSKGI